MKMLDKGVVAAKGFKATGLNAGIKNNVKKDMALVYSEVPCKVAGTFTTNLVKAAPVKWDQKVV
ncbi:MAG: bifunctional ornithine acetyltransferase/N-acetylglutamate synthase, partial [Lachnospiraceae bacterium]|nr:bifunctional ornithine acetyltransferase/N-acetylglutamate synthase [Lachnospiraceae bacterium]